MNFTITPNKTLIEKAQTIGFAFCILVLWITFTQALYNICFKSVVTVNFSLQIAKMITIPTAFGMFFLTCIIAPLSEELLFRCLPISILSRIDNGKYMWQIIGIISIIFGLLHGSSFNILIQGVLGVVLSYVYLKNDKSYWSCVILHFLYNFYVIYGFEYIIK